MLLRALIFPPSARNDNVWSAIRPVPTTMNSGKMQQSFNCPDGNYRVRLADEDAIRPPGLRKRSNPSKKLLAKEMRRHPSHPEELLWTRLRELRVDGLILRRQAVVLGWIADFWCPAVRLVVEIDGANHASREAEDRLRDSVMARSDINVLRFKASHVLRSPDSAASTVRGLVLHLRLHGRGRQRTGPHPEPIQFQPPH